MKNTIYLFMILIVGFFYGCKKENSVQTNGSTQLISTGRVGLSFDKTSTPAGVALVSAILSRQGYESQSKNLNVVTDSSAELTFDKIPVGSWNLKVDAYDAGSTLLFTGQTDVIIAENLLTQVNLVLQPALSGTGSIKISVSWGNSTNNSSWSDYGNNPILKKQGTKYDGRGIGYPIILKDDSLYRMYFSNMQSQADSNGAMCSVGLATSIDGIIWKHYSQEPVLKPTKNSWDAAMVVSGQVLKDGSVYKMYYLGTSTSGGLIKIGLATSLDGIHWEKRSEPVFQGTTGWEYNIGMWGVVKVNGTYFMYYNSAIPQFIGLATSNDGINWTRYSGNPIVIPTQSWENSGIANASVFVDNGLFKMAYINGDYSASFGYATSKDGITWTKDLMNPIFSKNKTLNNWTPGAISYVSLLKVGAQERIYYTGFNQNVSEMSIGFGYKK